MKLMMFVNEILDLAVDALHDCSNNDEVKARAKLLEVSRKIQNEMPAIKEPAEPWPGQSQF